MAKDGVGKNYNVEVQKKPEGAHIRRVRFNSSMMDSRMLKEGQEFSELQDSYMVFITQKDIFGRGISIYTINRHFFGCRESKDMYYSELDKGVKHFKEEEGGRKIMGEAVERYAGRKVAIWMYTIYLQALIYEIKNC